MLLPFDNIFIISSDECEVNNIIKKNKIKTYDERPKKLPSTKMRSNSKELQLCNWIGVIQLPSYMN